MSADPWHEARPWLAKDIPDVRDLFNPTENPLLPFDSIHSTQGGLIARQVHGNDPVNLGLTWYLNRDLTSEIILPVPLIMAPRPESLRQALAGYLHVDSFISALHKRSFKNVKILDLNHLFAILIGTFDTLSRLCAAAGWIKPVHGTFKLLNMSRMVPFVDIERVVSSYDAIGVPVTMRSRSALLDSHHPDTFQSFIGCEGDEEVDAESANDVNAFIMFMRISIALGIPAFENKDALGGLYPEALSASLRSLSAQKLRKSNPE